MKGQFYKAVKEDGKYYPFVEVNLDAVRMYNHPMGCALVKIILSRIRDCIINSTGSEFWVDGNIFVGVFNA